MKRPYNIVYDEIGGGYSVAMRTVIWSRYPKEARREFSRQIRRHPGRGFRRVVRSIERAN